MDLTESGSLKALILVHPYLTLLELKGIEDNGATLRLGHVEVDKDYAGVRAFAAGYSTRLKHSSQFRIVPCEVPTISFAGYVVIYRQQAHAEHNEEYLAGWVRPGCLADAERWVDRMNRHIARVRG